MEAVMRLPTLVSVFWSAIKSFQSDNVPRLGAALAYYTLFAIAPVLLVLIAIAGFVFGAEAVRGEIVGQLRGLLGTDGALLVQGLLESAARPRDGILATIIGGVMFLLAVTGAFNELQGALNQIWRVKPRPGSMIKEFLEHRIRSFGLVVSIGFLMLVSLAVSAGLAALGAWLNRLFPGAAPVLNILNILVSLAVTTMLFGLLYIILPDVKLRWRDVFVGAFVTSLLFNIGKQLIGLYLGQTATASAFGAAGSIVVLMIWVYYSSQIVLLGAEFTRVYMERKHSKPKLETYAERDHEQLDKDRKREGDAAGDHVGKGGAGARR
jgi:membrane protein